LIPHAPQNFDQPLRGKADDLAQQIGVRAFLQKRPRAHHVVGRRKTLDGHVVGAQTLLEDQRRLTCG
jgi:hypothetical protein